MKKLDRLTREALQKAEQGGKADGWYNLLVLGYLPEEISIHTYPRMTPSDVVTRVRQFTSSHSLPLPVSCAPKKEKRGDAPITDWRQSFKQNVMRTGMNLSLTQPMLEFLCATAEDVIWDRNTASSSLAKPDCFLVSSVSLAKRGLIERKCESERRKILNSRDDDPASPWRLTEAGHAVVLLLKSVGIFVEADAAIRKKTKTA